MTKKARNYLAFVSALLILSTLLTPPFLPIQAATLPPLIRLQYATFNPLAGEPSIPTGQRLDVQTGRPATYLLQFAGPVHDDWKARVEAAGARLYGYVPDYAFIARMDGATAGKVQALPFVRWVGPYHPAYRLAPTLQTSEVSQTLKVLAVTMQTLPGTDLDSLAKQVKALGGDVQAQSANDFAGYLRLNMPANRLPDLAAMDEVLWVEPYFEPQLYNDVGGGSIMRANDVRTSLGLYGSGQTVAVADTGLDTGNQSTLHPDVKGRVVKTYALGRPGDWSDPNGHGTHVAGSVLGNGTQSGSVPASHQYTNSYAGVAPEAQLVFQSVGDAQGGLDGIPPNYGDLMRTAYNDGARIHTNSWGAPAAGSYGDGSQQVDQAMWEHPDMLILFSAGNNGVDADSNGVIDPDSVGQPGTAKNVLTVGASENDRASIAATWGASYGEPIASDKRADDPDGLAAFSSRGPTDDGRIKPDLVAPGAYIASLRTHQYVFDDDMEGDTSGYTTGYLSGGTGNTWQLLTDAPHSSTHYWKNVVNGTFTPGAMTILLTPQMNVMPTGGAFDIHFWHKYNLGSQDHLVIIFADGDGTVIWLTLNLSGSQGTYTLQTTTMGISTLLYYDVDPTTLQIGFAISSDDATYNSQWWLDDVRVDGSDWGTMSSVGLAQPGDATDEAYLMMGGTSMSTPLTAGAAAMVREWLTRIKGVANPSGALMKAVLVNGAADMSPGQYTSPQEIPAARPNNVTGWGRVDLVESVDPPAPRKVWFKDYTTGLSTGGSVEYTLSIGSSQAQGRGEGETGRQGDEETHHPATPTPTPTPTSVPALPHHSITPAPFVAATGSGNIHPLGTSQLLQNPGFDTGTWTPWQPLGYPELTDQVYRSASYSAWLAGYNNADDYIYQSVTVPSDATEVVLDFWYRVYSEETAAHHDYLCYDITDGDGSTLINGSYCDDLYDTTQGQWINVQHTLSSADLTPLLGQTVLVWFYAQTDAADFSSAWVDDTALNVTTGGGPTETPTPTPTPTGTPPPCPEALSDGGFEASTGDTSNPHWTVSGNARFTVNQGIARTGEDAAILGYTSGPPDTGDLWQAVSVPADASSATLSFWYQTMGDGSFTVDVDVTDSSGSTVLVHLTTLTSATYDWQQYNHSFTSGELASIAGQNTRLRFRISGSSIPEDVVIDDVSWQICTGGAPPQTGGPFRFTLAWTDYPGTLGAAKALVNDLDLEIIGPDGTHYYGNAGLYTSGQCLRGGQWDACNNVEGVIIPDASYGTYTVIVHGYNVAQGPQPFALVASGDNLRDGSGPPPTYDNFVYLPLVLRNK